jgi:hypothetical protein
VGWQKFAVTAAPIQQGSKLLIEGTHVECHYCSGWSGPHHGPDGFLTLRSRGSTCTSTAVGGSCGPPHPHLAILTLTTYVIPAKPRWRGHISSNMLRATMPSTLPDNFWGVGGYALAQQAKHGCPSFSSSGASTPLAKFSSSSLLRRCVRASGVSIVSAAAGGALPPSQHISPCTPPYVIPVFILSKHSYHTLHYPLPS